MSQTREQIPKPFNTKLTKFLLANMWASKSVFDVTYKTPNRENTNDQISLVWNLLIIMLVKNFCVLVVFV